MFVPMNEGLGAYIRAKRESPQVGMSQTELAARANMTKGHVSEIERGKIGLPGPEVRRQLAKALGVTHLDLLIAAGEIRPDEIEEANKQGVTTLDPELQELFSEIAQTHWDDDGIDMLKSLLRMTRRDR